MRSGWKKQSTKGRGFTLIELMIVVVVVGVLAAIAIPHFQKLQARARRSEVKAALKSAFVAERAYGSQFDGYSARMVDVGFDVARGNRYRYVFVDGCAITETRTSVTDAKVPGQSCIDVDTFKNPSLAPDPATAVTEFVTKSAFLLGAAANVDQDPELDQWSISSESRVSGAASSDTTCASGPSPAGEPCEDWSD